MFIWTLLLSDTARPPVDPERSPTFGPASRRVDDTPTNGSDPSDENPVSPDSYETSNGQYSGMAMGGVALLRSSAPTAARFVAPTALESASAAWGEAAILDGGLAGATVSDGAAVTAGLMTYLGSALLFCLPFIDIQDSPRRPSREYPETHLDTEEDDDNEIIIADTDTDLDADFSTDLETVGVPDFGWWQKWKVWIKHQFEIERIRQIARRFNQLADPLIQEYLDDNGLTLEDIYSAPSGVTDALASASSKADAAATPFATDEAEKSLRRFGLIIERFEREGINQEDKDDLFEDLLAESSQYPELQTEFGLLAHRVMQIHEVPLETRTREEIEAEAAEETEPDTPVEAPADGSHFLDASTLRKKILEAKAEGKKVVVEIGCGDMAAYLRRLARTNPAVVYFGIDPTLFADILAKQSLPENIFFHRGQGVPALEALRGKQAIDEILIVAPEGSEDFNRRRAKYNPDLAQIFLKYIPEMTVRNGELQLYHHLLAPGGKMTIYTEVLEWAFDHYDQLAPVADRMETAMYADDIPAARISPTETELKIPYMQDISDDQEPLLVPVYRQPSNAVENQWGSVAGLFDEETETPVFPRNMAPLSTYSNPASWPYVFKVMAHKASPNPVETTTEDPSQVLSKLSRLMDIDEHPQRERALSFLNAMINEGLQSEGKFRDPAQTTVAIVGFGEETATIKVFLDAGYQVVAVEDFSYLKVAGGPKKAEIEDKFRDHRHFDRLTIIDVAEEATLPEADLVIASALIDEAFETSAKLVKPGGIIAVTEMGQVGSKRINYIVDEPGSYIRKAQGIPRTFEEVLYFNTIHGPSILPGNYFHMFGHSAYILRRTE